MTRLRRFGMVIALIGMIAVLCGCTMPKQEGAGQPPATGPGPAGGAAATPPPEDIKIGFIVKQPEEPWFQAEWKFAEKAAEKYGFELLKIGATTPEEALNAIDNVAAEGAQGFVICTPEVRMGPAIVSKANEHGLKLISVDDRFVDSDGEPIEDVHYLGISARKIGRMVGEKLYERMQERGWNVTETGACKVTYDQLATARQRTEGGTEALIEKGFPADNIHEAPLETADVPNALSAVQTLLVRNPEPKKWLIFGMNDSAVLGAVRAMENRGFGADDVIGIGINGTQAVNEFEKNQPTGFYGSILLQPKRHGFDTAEMMYKWIHDGEEPPLDTRTTGTLITRDNFRQELKEQGLWELLRPEEG